MSTHLRPKTPVNLNLENDYDALMRTIPFEEPETIDENLMNLRDAVESHMNVLTQREHWIVTACISEGKSLQAIADQLSITKTHVWRLRNQAFEKLRNAMSTDTTIRKSVRLAETWEQSAMQWVMHLAGLEGINSRRVAIEDMRIFVDALEMVYRDERDTTGVQNTFEAIAQQAIEELRFCEMWDSGQMVSTLIGKQHDYGHGNITRFGIYGVIVRLSDKVERLDNLTSKNVEAYHESTYDTLIDIVGYSVIALMLLDETFTLELGDDYGTNNGHN